MKEQIPNSKLQIQKTPNLKTQGQKAAFFEIEIWDFACSRFIGVWIWDLEFGISLRPSTRKSLFLLHPADAPFVSCSIQQLTHFLVRRLHEIGVPRAHGKERLRRFSTNYLLYFVAELVAGIARTDRDGNGDCCRMLLAQSAHGRPH